MASALGSPGFCFSIPAEIIAGAASGTMTTATGRKVPAASVEAASVEAASVEAASAAEAVMEAVASPEAAADADKRNNIEK